MPRMTHKIRCYTGPMSADTDGLIVVYTQRQAENLLKIGHKRFMAEWKAVESVGPPAWATKFVVYVRVKGKLIWSERGD